MTNRTTQPNIKYTNNEVTSEAKSQSPIHNKNEVMSEAKSPSTTFKKNEAYRYREGSVVTMKVDFIENCHKFVNLDSFDSCQLYSLEI